MTILDVGICLQKCVSGVCSALIDKEELLNELDRGIGDGDCGSTLKAGATGKKNEFIRSMSVSDGLMSDIQPSKRT